MKTEHSYSAKGVLAALGRSALYLLFFVAVQVLLPFVYGIGIAADAAINRGADLAQGAQAVAERLILSNPAQGCKLPQLEKREMRILPQEKIGMYLAEAERRGLLAAFYLELTTGLRRGELLALQWTDLDVESKTLSITKQVNRINGELVVSPPKTRNSVRTLALPQQAVDLLVAEHKKHPRNPYLFPSPKTGTMYDPDAFRRTHDKILKAIGAEHIRFHDLRHTFATLSLKSGVYVKTLSGALGHYSAGFTLDTYAHVTTNAQLKAAQTMGNILSCAV